MNYEPTRIAVALEYDGETAPKVTAKGINNIADKNYRYSDGKRHPPTKG